MLLLGIAFLVFVQVILRYVLHRPLMGIEEMLAFPAIWLYFLGGAMASQERTHIQVRVIEVFIHRAKSIYLTKIIMATIAFGVATWLTYTAYHYFIYTIHAGKLSGVLYWPLVYAEFAVFFGFVLMAVYTLTELIDYIVKFSTGKT